MNLENIAKGGLILLFAFTFWLLIGVTAYNSNVYGTVIYSHKYIGAGHIISQASGTTGEFTFYNTTIAYNHTSFKITLACDLYPVDSQYPLIYETLYGYFGHYSLSSPPVGCNSETGIS